jgi:hypothetical protein
MTPPSPAAETPDPAMRPLVAFLLARLEDAYQATGAAADPARAEADVDARRALITLHTAQLPAAHWCPWWIPPGSPTIPDPWNVGVDFKVECTTLRLLALPDADHPDYQAEWIVEAPNA